LQEAAEADLLLHVVDAASPVLQEQMAEVQKVLHEIGAGDIPQLLVYNKLDRLGGHQQPRELVDELEVESGRRVPRVFISARDGIGLPQLRQLIAQAAQGASGLNSPDPSQDRVLSDADEMITPAWPATGTFQSKT
jgi:GTP-binding protein HflX